MLGLIRSVDWHAEIFALLRGQAGEFHADFFEVQAGDFFVELFRERERCRDVRLSFIIERVIPF